MIVVLISGEEPKTNQQRGSPVDQMILHPHEISSWVVPGQFLSRSTQSKKESDDEVDTESAVQQHNACGIRLILSQDQCLSHVGHRTYSVILNHIY